jgi:hypothetical protein
MPVYGSINNKNNKKTTQAGGRNAVVKRKTNKRKLGYVSFKKQLSRVKNSKKNAKKKKGGGFCGYKKKFSN